MVGDVLHWHTTHHPTKWCDRLDIHLWHFGLNEQFSLKTMVVKIIGIKFLNHFIVEIVMRVNQHVPVPYSNYQSHVPEASLFYDFKFLFKPNFSFCQLSEPFFMFRTQKSCWITCPWCPGSVGYGLLFLRGNDFLGSNSYNKTYPMLSITNKTCYYVQYSYNELKTYIKR